MKYDEINTQSGTLPGKIRKQPIVNASIFFCCVFTHHNMTRSHFRGRASTTVVGVANAINKINIRRAKTMKNENKMKKIKTENT